MSQPISIRDLREAAEQGDYFLNAETMLALLDAVEAARLFCDDFAPSADDAVAYAGELALRAALARFDFGDQP